jgi:hypothetical protein
MNGPWRAQTIFGPNSFFCDFNFTQTGMSLSISGTCQFIDTVNLTGTINPGSGVFSASGTAGTECPTLVFTLGTAALDNRTWFAGFICDGGPNGSFQGALQGFRCGNGVVDAITGEECDLAIHQCCDGTFFACSFSPPGAFCGDGNQCTDDACDGAGTCVSTNRTGPCDDGEQCTGPDECVGGSCTTTVLPDGSACSDFNDCTSDSCQAGSCESANVPNGAPCDDSEACLEGETCLKGECHSGDPVVCPA